MSSKNLIPVAIFSNLVYEIITQTAITIKENFRCNSISSTAGIKCQPRITNFIHFISSSGDMLLLALIVRNVCWLSDSAELVQLRAACNSLIGQLTRILSGSWKRWSLNTHNAAPDAEQSGLQEESGGKGELLMAGSLIDTGVSLATGAWEWQPERGGVQRASHH